MSESNDERALKPHMEELCAACGKGGDLKWCTACKIAKYCDRRCQASHRKQHKHECRLFSKPPPLKDCPICMVPMASIGNGNEHAHEYARPLFRGCCLMEFCIGCIHANAMSFNGADPKCPFCRQLWPDSDDVIVKEMKHRAANGHAHSTFLVGCFYSNGERGLPQDHQKALEYWEKAGELGHAEALCEIGGLYHDGSGGVEKDVDTAIHYWQKAAMLGHEGARYDIGALEIIRAGDMKRAQRHFAIAAEAGHDLALEGVRLGYTQGYVTKEEFAKSLRAHKACVDEMKTKERLFANEMNKEMEEERGGKGADEWKGWKPTSRFFFITPDHKKFPFEK